MRDHEGKELVVYTSAIISTPGAFENRYPGDAQTQEFLKRESALQFNARGELIDVPRVFTQLTFNQIAQKVPGAQERLSTKADGASAELLLAGRGDGGKVVLELLKGLQDLPGVEGSYNKAKISWVVGKNGPATIDELRDSLRPRYTQICSICDADARDFAVELIQGDVVEVKESANGRLSIRVEMKDGSEKVFEKDRYGNLIGYKPAESILTPLFDESFASEDSGELSAPVFRGKLSGGEQELNLGRQIIDARGREQERSLC